MRAGDGPKIDDQHEQRAARGDGVGEQRERRRSRRHSRSPMMPEPTTAASSSAVPIASARAAAAQRQAAAEPRRLGACRWRRGAAAAPCRSSVAIGRLTKSLMRFSRRRRRRRKAARSRLACPSTAAGSGNAPMRRHRLARPDRTDFAGGVVADGEDEIQRRRAGCGELVPALGAQPLGRKPRLPSRSSA